MCAVDTRELESAALPIRRRGRRRIPGHVGESDSFRWRPVELTAGFDVMGSFIHTAPDMGTTQLSRAIDLRRDARRIASA